MDNNVFFLTSLFPDEILSEINKLSNGAIANANNQLQWNLYLGLSSYYPNLKLINFPNVGAYPFRYKSITVSGCDIKKNDQEIGQSYSFINLICLKHQLKYFKLIKLLESILNKKSINEKFIFFVYDLYPPFLKALSILKKEYVNIHLCLIVPDIQGMTGGKENIISNYLLKRDKKIVLSSYKEVDSFVLISKYMKELIPMKNKPYAVVEGIFNESNIKKADNVLFGSKYIKNNCIRIFYSGALDERNGVLNLLEAFKLINNNNYRLVICGEGPLKPTIQKHSKEDKRIVYLGQLSHNEIIALQPNMDLLVNPRLPEQNFTKYSFPSKTMEYFASGVPTLMYRLEGVPEEYLNYCFVAEKSNTKISDIEILRDTIIDIFKLPIEAHNDIAIKARKFILDKKNPNYQCEKIYNLIAI